MNEKSQVEFKDILHSFEESKVIFGDVLQGLRNHIIPESYAQFSGDVLSPTQLEFSSLILRDDLLMLSGHALVAYDWVRPLAHLIGKRRCLEVMCGCGCLAKALADCGVDIIATDNFSWENCRQCWFEKSWTEIEKMDAVAAVKKYGKETDLVIMSWPYMDDTAYNVLMEMRVQNPAAKLIFIGEWNGATADEKFFQEANLIEDPRFYKAVSAFRQHSSVHDKPYLLC